MPTRVCSRCRDQPHAPPLSPCVRACACLLPARAVQGVPEGAQGQHGRGAVGADGVAARHAAARRRAERPHLLRCAAPTRTWGPGTNHRPADSPIQSAPLALAFAPHHHTRRETKPSTDEPTPSKTYAFAPHTHARVENATGKIRIPLYFAIFMTFLFPLYGVDSCCIILFWIAQKKVFLSAQEHTAACVEACVRPRLRFCCLDSARAHSSSMRHAA